MLAYAVEAGLELIEAKRGMPHGTFQSWIEANCEFSVRQARRYIALSKTDVDVPFEELTEAWAQLNGNRPAAPLPQFTRDDAERILKLAAMANGGNENEEIVACEMLDKWQSDRPLMDQTHLGPTQTNPLAANQGVKPVRTAMRKPTPAPVPPGFKHCYTCATDKPVQSFYLDRSTLDGRCSYCRHCHRRHLADRAHRQRVMSESWERLRGR